MKTYKYVERVLDNGKRFYLVAELDGCKSRPGARTVAVATYEDDAKMIVDALNKEGENK